MALAECNIAMALGGSPALIGRLREVVGRRNVLTGRATNRFANGYRFGGGPVLAVVRPGTLLEFWDTLNICVGAGAGVIVQAANTGLTGGSTPAKTSEHAIVIINTLRLDRIVPINGGMQTLCYAGSTLHALERALRPYGREPHSLIGSSCLGASVVGGICNSSGGALIERGPAYTELALFARLRADGRLELVNRLGVELGDDPVEIFSTLDNSSDASLARRATSVEGLASASDYVERVRQIEADTPARYNANPDMLHDASGCAGKLAVFAVRMDSFPTKQGVRTYVIGANGTDTFWKLRRHILSDFGTLPISAEYIHSPALEFADRYGRDTVALIQIIGTAKLPTFFAIRSRLERLFSHGLVEYALHLFAKVLPSLIPPRVAKMQQSYEHLLLLTLEAIDAEKLERYIRSSFESADFIACSPQEAGRVAALRYAVAGAANRYASVNHRTVQGIVALDIALPRNCRNWLETLPEQLADMLVERLYYGHFFCYVFHQDYLIKKNVDMKHVEAQLLALASSRGAKYPAEHNVGRKYVAEQALRDHYDLLDPLDRMNPGVGGVV